MTSPHPTPSEPISVLVVDDDKWTTKAINMALQKDPAIRIVIAASDGAEGVEAYRSSSPDIVLMDLNMSPGMNGVTAIEKIRQFDAEARIIVLTTVSPGPGLARALEAGALAVAQKTASEADLRKIVLAATQGDDPRLLKRLAQDIVISGDLLPDTPVVVPQLTPAERDILLLITDGHGYEEIAKRQGITVWTVRSHVKKLREKLYAENLAQLVVRALQYRYISP